MAIWSGVIAFGLVTIGVRVEAATEDRSVGLHQIHVRDHSRVRHERVCIAENKPVPWEEIGKGFEAADGRIVPITDEDLANLPLPSLRTVEVLKFLPWESIDPIHFDRSYYLYPDRHRAARKPYELLRDTLQKSGRVALVKVALRQRERLAVLRVVSDVILMVTMLWPDEVRAPELDSRSGPAVPTQPHEQDMADQLVQALSEDVFDPSEYHDAYRAALQRIIDDKLAGTEHAAAPAPGASTVATDLAEALRASIASAKGARRGAGSSPHSAAATERPRGAHTDGD